MTLTGLAAGFHAVARLPAGADELAIAAAVRERDVGVYPLSRYRLAGGMGDGPGLAPGLDQGPFPGLVLGFGNLDVGPIRRGIETIGDLIR